MSLWCCLLLLLGTITIHISQAQGPNFARIEGAADGVPLQVNESDVFLEVCVVLTFNVTDLVTVQVLDQTVDQAERNVDYSAINETLVFNVSTEPPRLCFDVEIAQDDLEEGPVPEEFGLVLSLLSGDAVLDSSFLPLVAIQDSDVLSISFMQVFNVTEGESEMACASITNDALVGEGIEVRLNIQTQEGTATGGDFQVSPGTLVFSSDQLQPCVTVTAVDDELIEAAESFTLTLMQDSVEVEFMNNLATITIQDNDEINFVRIEGVSDGVPLRVNESEGLLEVCVVLSINTSDPVTVQTQDLPINQAQRNVDYTEVNEILMFNASTVPRMCFNIEITRDNIEEGAVPEEFALLLLILDGPAAPDISFLPLVAIHDSNVLSVSFAQSAVEMREGENQTLCANISNGALVGEDIEVLVNVQAQGESATGGDFQVSPGTLVFSSDQLQPCVIVTAVDDELIEATESFTLTLIQDNIEVAFVDSLVTITILDNDGIWITLMQTVLELSEGEARTLCANIVNGTIEEDTAVQVNIQTQAVTANSEDFQVLAEPVFVFTHDVLQSCITISAVDDELIEASTESFTVTLAEDDPAVVLLEDLATITVTDNDGNEVITIATLIEGYGGESSAVLRVDQPFDINADTARTVQELTVSLVGEPSNLRRNVVVNVTTTGGTELNEVLVLSGANPMQIINFVITGDVGDTPTITFTAMSGDSFIGGRSSVTITFSIIEMSTDAATPDQNQDRNLRIGVGVAAGIGVLLVIVIIIIIVTAVVVLSRRRTHMRVDSNDYHEYGDHELPATSSS